MSRPNFVALGAVCCSLLVLAARPAPAQSGDPVVVALMTGFNPGANPGMAILNARLQAVFGGSGANPPFASQVFAYTNQSGAAAFIAAQGPTAKVVLIGHSLGAESNFGLAKNVLGPQGIDVDLQISVDYVAFLSRFSPTTPVVPTQILKAYNYHQTSTAFLEPVPSSVILGAARNLNMETVFADTSLTHTTVDCDARVHELVVARIRELFLPPPYPGTDEDVDLFCRTDVLNSPCNPGGGIAVAGVLTSHALQTAAAGQWVTLRTVSPEGDFAGAAFGILGEIFTTGAPPTSILPGLASALTPGAMIMITPGLIQYPPTQFAALPAPGFSVSFCWPTGLVGISVLTQTVILAPNAANGVYATSLGFELRGV